MVDDGGERQVAIRRWGDGCFHRVEEVVEEGYIIGGVLISKDDVVDVIEVGVGEVCPRRVMEMRLPEGDAKGKVAGADEVAKGGG